MKTDIIIVGCGVAGLYCALNLPKDKKIVIITKKSAPKSDSYLAQGGICVLRDEKDYESFYEDTMRAADFIVEAAKAGEFLSRDDFKTRCKVSQTITDKMGELGLLGDIPASNQMSLMDLFKI